MLRIFFPSKYISISGLGGGALTGIVIAAFIVVIAVIGGSILGAWIWLQRIRPNPKGAVVRAPDPNPVNPLGFMQNGAYYVGYDYPAPSVSFLSSGLLQ